MEKTQKELRQITGSRVVEWMKANNISCKELGAIVNYSPRYIQSIRQGARDLPRGIAHDIVNEDRRRHAHNPGESIRLEYLLGKDDLRTIDDARAEEAALNLAMDMWYEIDAKETAFYWVYRMAGYRIESFTAVDGVKGFTVSTEDGAPRPTLSVEEVEELKADIVDYAAYRVQRLLNRKEAASDGVNEKTDN